MTPEEKQMHTAGPTSALVETLVAARARIADPKNWTTAWSARSKHDRPIGPRTFGAVCWCALGAIEAVQSHGERAYLAKEKLRSAAQQLGFGGVINANDDPNLGHPAVLQIYDKAIADAQAALSRASNNG